MVEGEERENARINSRCAKNVVAKCCSNTLKCYDHPNVFHCVVYTVRSRIFMSVYTYMCGNLNRTNVAKSRVAKKKSKRNERT